MFEVIAKVLKGRLNRSPGCQSGV